MSNGAIRFSEEVEYYTPKYIVDKFGPFDFDPATTERQALKHGIWAFADKEHDGLSMVWTCYNRIWINPPFTQKKEFLEKAVHTWELSRNEIYILLPISFLTTKSFHNMVKGAKIYLPNGRIKFESPTGKLRSPAFGSVIIKLQDSWEVETLEI